VILVTVILSGLTAVSAFAESHATITKAIGKRFTGRVVVEGTMTCDLREPYPWEPPRAPECSGEPLDSAFVFVNAYGQRCGKPGGFMGADLDRSYSFTTVSYDFRVVGHVNIRRAGEPTVACLTKTEYTTQPNPDCAAFFDPSLCATEPGPEYWHEIARAPIKWEGRRKPIRRHR